ncbi:MAG: hypothetical protein H5T59_11680, partial [Anaerolineae bacterium]|nr:hypothetical protein [Anaerolineae bacterium]
MQPTWVPVLWALASLAALVVANRWFDRHLWNLAYLLSGDEVVADFVHFAVLLPGVVLHEVSHWVMARLLGLRVGRLEIWPEAGDEGLRLGSVQVQQPDPLRGSLVGVAPLAAGSAVLLLVGWQVFGLEGLLEALAQGDGGAIWGAFLTMVRARDLWLWAYLVFAVANAMLPSPADRQAWRPLLLYTLLLVAAYWLLGGSLPTLPASAWQAAAAALERLAAAFTLALAVNLVFGMLLLGAEV